MQNRSDVTVDVVPLVGAVAESVTVESPPIALEFNSSGSALTIENKSSISCRSGRNPYNVVTLDPTVSPGTGSTSTKPALSPCVCQRH